MVESVLEHLHSLTKENIKSQKQVFSPLALLSKCLEVYEVQRTPVPELYDEEYYAEEEPPSVLSKGPILDAVRHVVSLVSLSAMKEVGKVVAVILSRVQRKTGELVEQDLDCFPEGLKAVVWQKVTEVEVV